MVAQGGFGYAISFSGTGVYEGNTVARIDNNADVAYFTDFTVGTGKKDQVSGQRVFQLYFFTNVRIANRAARHCNIEVVEYVHYKTGTIKTFPWVGAGIFVTCAFKGLRVGNKIGGIEHIGRYCIAIGFDLGS